MFCCQQLVQFHYLKKKTFCKPVIQKREEKKTIYATIQNEEKPNTV